jgi:hypothetical protein
MTTPLSAEDRRLMEAAYGPAFPCNALPFLQGIRDRLKRLQTNSLQEPRAREDPVIRACMIVLAWQYNGQIGTLDVTNQWVIGKAEHAALEASAAGMMEAARR